MDLLTLLAFTIAYVVAVLVPGPGVAAIVSRALGGGFLSAVPMIVGILVGDLIYLVFALFGLAAIATYFGAVFVIVRWAGALYLLYIAWKFWTAKPGAEQLGPRTKEHWSRTFFAGFALTMGNPKTIVFYLALLPTVVPLDKPISALGFTELTAIVVVVLLAIGCGYAALAAWAREFFTSPRAIRRLNRIAGVIMASAAAFVVARG
ncbi:MAG: LysE family translocator [Devosia nanyangense]|uniref:LysE family translocator n=1 Tax=Devosia nanyangense TaxID=1228055 RepID=A0A933KXT9_9HYPH|nr:LysE family translocator [Devosia nanyangense]